MALDDETTQRLKELLRDATALVYVDGQTRGTAFFISDDLLLTCAHVVSGHVQIKPRGRALRDAEIVHPNEDTDADLALLHSPAEQDDLSPCVFVGRDMPDGSNCIIAGYPLSDEFGMELQVVTAPAHWLGDHLGLVIEPGQLIEEGMSGSPVLSTANGAVVGIVRSSAALRDPYGGRAIPISRAAEVFAEVAQVMKENSPCLVQWRDALGRENWGRLNRSWEIGREIDLSISGSFRNWQVKIEHNDQPLLIGDHDLGERVAEAIFRWARRRYPRRSDEVALLGQLLARALFPVDMPAWLKVRGSADRVVVRLHIEPDGDETNGNVFMGIPWEITADPFSTDRERFLAADRRFVLTRVMNDGGESSAPPEPKPAGAVRVLTVVTEPSGWEHKDIPGEAQGGHHAWPGVAALREGLRTGILDGGFQDVTTLVPAIADELLDRLETSGPYDVLHYMGTGDVSQGEPRIVFTFGDGREHWEGVRRIFRTAAETGVRLVVLELMMPPEHRDFDQLTCQSLDAAISGTVPAVVLTNLPVYPDQCDTFNRVLYRAMGRGDSVDSAVQKARRTLRQCPSNGDEAGFGWFTFLTARRAETYLVARPQALEPAQRGAPALGLRQAAGRTGDVDHR